MPYLKLILSGLLLGFILVALMGCNQDDDPNYWDVQGKKGYNFHKIFEKDNCSVYTSLLARKPTIYIGICKDGNSIALGKH